MKKALLLATVCNTPWRACTAVQSARWRLFLVRGSDWWLAGGHQLHRNRRLWRRDSVHVFALPSTSFDKYNCLLQCVTFGGHLMRMNRSVVVIC